MKKSGKRSRQIIIDSDSETESVDDISPDKIQAKRGKSSSKGTGRFKRLRRVVDDSDSYPEKTAKKKKMAALARSLPTPEKIMKKRKRCPRGSRRQKNGECGKNVPKSSRSEGKSSTRRFLSLSAGNCISDVKVNYRDQKPVSRHIYKAKQNSWGPKVNCGKSCYKKLMEGEKRHVKHILMESQKPEMMDALREMM